MKFAKMKYNLQFCLNEKHIKEVVASMQLHQTEEISNSITIIQVITT